MKPLVWLMSRFNVSSELIGDIAEDSAHHSIFWLLHQSLAAILSTVSSGLWTHKLHTIRAVILGWILLIGGLVLVARDATSVLDDVHTAAWCFFVGWAISRAHRVQPIGAVLVFLATVLAAMTPIFISATGRWLHPAKWGVFQIWPLFALTGVIHFFTLLGALPRQLPACLRITDSPTPD